MEDIIKDILPVDLPLSNNSIIKVIGVGGGGGNAVNHMYNQGINDVSFVVCNTDYQDLEFSPVPIKIQIGEAETSGLGAGGMPEIGEKSANESIETIRNLLSDNTKMVFITAGMGGGTGTGASPVVAKVASDLNILTVGIVTIPFAFEGIRKIKQAFKGIAKLSEHVDALLVINNEKLKHIYPDLNLSNAFAKADDVLSNAAKAIAEIITKKGHINIDFADVNTIMRKGKVAIMNTGFASGENRITLAIEDALNSPLLNTSDVRGASRVLLSIYCSKEHEIRMEEVTQVHEFMEKVGKDVTVIWGITFDDTLGEKVKITLIATGFEVSDLPVITRTEIGQPIEKDIASIIQNTESKSGTERSVNDSTTDESEKSTEHATESKIEEDIAITPEILKTFYGDSIDTKEEKENQTIITDEEEFEDKNEGQFILEGDEIGKINTINLDDLEDLNSEELQKKRKIPAYLRRERK